MASVSISEQDFLDVSAACLDARRRGDEEAAQRLNRLCRKMNGALSVDTLNRVRHGGFSPMSRHKNIDAPGPLDGVLSVDEPPKEGI